MEELKKFKISHNLCDAVFVLYGSRIYQTHSDNSDFDYLALIPDNCELSTGTEFRDNLLNVQVYKESDFKNQLNDHKIIALETYFSSEELRSKFKLNLDLRKLRNQLVEKSSHSFVKAKKKIEIEKDYIRGWKSLFHSLRILIYGTQIAENGKIIDFTAANPYWHEIINAQQYNWDYFKQKYQPIYNQLSSEFRKVAPKQN